RSGFHKPCRRHEIPAPGGVRSPWCLSAPRGAYAFAHPNARGEPAMPTFLLKTEPGTYSYADLVREKKTVWSGVANPAALKALRTARKGDEAFIYHTGDERAVVGLAKVVSDPYEDPKQPGRTPEGAPKFAVIDIKPVRAAKSPVSLGTMKS